MACELCGEETELVEAKIEGTVLEVCKDCAELGEVLERGQIKQKKKPKKESLPHQPEQILVNGYGSTVKRARENKEMNIADLAEEIKEKESVVHRIENENLRPDKDLARKLERFLDIKLYENATAESVSSSSSQEVEGVTLGDVAEVERKSED